MTELIAEGKCPKGFPVDIFKTARRKLEMIHAAKILSAFKKPPGNKLHLLEDNRAGRHAIWINAQFRICFKWTEDSCEDVEIVDYH
jgi:proteic killer suppression protein